MFNWSSSFQICSKNSIAGLLAQGVQFGHLDYQAPLELNPDDLQDYLTWLIVFRARRNISDLVKYGLPFISALLAKGALFFNPILCNFSKIWVVG